LTKDNQQCKVKLKGGFMRKVYVDITVKLVLEIDEGIELGEVINELDYNFTSTIDSATVVDSEIDNFEITDSK
jgi:hypothetical protein